MWPKNIFKALFALLFLLFPLGQFTKLASFGPANLFLNDIVVLLLAILWLFLKILKKEKLENPLFLPFATFFLIAFFSLLLNARGLTLEQFLISLLYLLRLIAYASLYFVVADLVKKKILQKTFFLNGLIFSGITLAVIGLLQYIFFPDMRVIKYLGWDDHYYRVITSFFDPNFTGLILASTCLLILPRLHLNKRAILLIIPAFLALLLTYSRASFLSFLAGISVFLYLQKKMFFIPLFVISFLILVFLLPRSPGGEGVKLERVSSILGRAESIKTAWQVFQNHPLIGVGFNTYKFYGSKDIYSHSSGGVENSYLLILATTGILGFLAFLNLLAMATGQVVKSQEDKFLRSSVISIFTAILVSGLFINSLFYPWVMVWIFLLLAIL